MTDADGGGRRESESLLGRVVAVRDNATAIAEVDCDGLSGHAQLGLVEDLERARRAVDAALAVVLAAVDCSGAATVASGLNTASWFAQQTGSSAGEAKARLKLGRLLGRFEAFAAAVRFGVVSIEHAEVLAGAANPRVIDRLVAIDDLLAETAAETTFKEWKRHVRALVSQLDADGPSPAGDRSTLSMQDLPDGALLIRGELHGEPAESFRQALEAETTRQRRTAWAEHQQSGTEMPTAGKLRARALVELVRRGQATPLDGSRAPRPDTIVVIEADDTIAGRVRTLDGEPIPADVAAMLTCDAFLQALITDRRGQPIWLGRSRRQISPGLRLALSIRDGGCVFPGCEMPPDWCDGHHQPEWRQGAPTDPAHMALLCRRHHGLAHSKDWTLRPTPPPGQPPNGPPDGSGLPGQRFEWVNHRTGAVTPATQRGLR